MLYASRAAAGPVLFLLSSTEMECASILKPGAGDRVNSMAGNALEKIIVEGKFFEVSPVGQAAPPVATAALFTRSRLEAVALAEMIAGIPEVLLV